MVYVGQMASAGAVGDIGKRGTPQGPGDVQTTDEQTSMWVCLF